MMKLNVSLNCVYIAYSCTGSEAGHHDKQVTIVFSIDIYEIMYNIIIRVL